MSLTKSSFVFTARAAISWKNPVIGGRRRLCISGLSLRHQGLSCSYSLLPTKSPNSRALFWSAPIPVPPEAPPQFSAPDHCFGVGQSWGARWPRPGAWPHLSADQCRFQSSHPATFRPADREAPRAAAPGGIRLGLRLCVRQPEQPLATLCQP